MSKIALKCEVTVGPYQGYQGRAVYDAQAKLFHGELLGTSDVITFAAKKLEQLTPAFRESVDDYLAFCRELEKTPEKPLSGKLVLRISPDLHRKIAVEAKASGKSLNQYIANHLESSIDQPPTPRMNKLALARKSSREKA